MLETDKHQNNNDVYHLLSQIHSEDKQNHLYGHLQKLYETKMEMNDDKKFIDLLEDISIRIKKDGKYFNKEHTKTSLFHYLEEFNKNAKKKKELIEPLTTKDPDGGEPTKIASVSFVPEYENIFQILEWVGISLGDKEPYLLTNSLRNLAFKKSLLNGVTFWGKIFGSEKDYYIAEASGVEPTGK